MSDVTDTLEALASGDKTLSEVIVEFMARDWPKIPRPDTPAEIIASVGDDPSPWVENSFDDVASAYHRGIITIQQYAALAHAVAGAGSPAPADGAPTDAPPGDAIPDGATLGA